MTRPYSDADLMAYSTEHVWYEIWMFFEMVEALSRRPTSASSYVASTSSGPHTSAPPPLGAVNSIAPLPGTSAGQSTLMNNVHVEAFMAHLRNLVEFLTTLNPDPTDVVAADFCAPGAWQPVLSQTLKDAKRRVNKELAHLTTGRISGSPARKTWDVNALAAELGPLLRDFTTKAAPTRLSPRVKSAIR